MQSAQAFGLEGHQAPAEALTEERVFHNPGWAVRDDLAPVKPDLYLVYDVGWDVPLSVNLQGADWKSWLGSMIVAQDKFPSCTGTPAERLAKLNELTRQVGWRGAGLWVHVQPASQLTGAETPSFEQMEAYFRERVIWCREAGITYWKVDYGKYCADLAFRAMLTRIGHEEYPELLVEHARNGGPLNDQPCPYDSAQVSHTGRFRAWDQGRIFDVSVETVSFSDVFRAYDLSYQLTTATMLDRVAQLLGTFSDQPQQTCLINCEDEPYLGAVLGCSFGIMHHPDKKPSKRGSHIRAAHWQRIAPAFGVGLTENHLDSQALFDSFRFQPGSDWVDWLDGRVITQGAPARVSRGMSLPEVACDGEPPFVLASQHPNGAVSVAALPRIDADRSRFSPRSRVTLPVADPSAPVGVFGFYENLELRLSQPPSTTIRVYAQDLAGGPVHDLTSSANIQGRRISLDGSLLEQVGLSANLLEDASQPALVLILDETSV